MELIQSKLFIFYESPEHAGKWIPARVSLYSDCKFEVKVPDEDKTSFNLSQNCILQVPLDSVWNRIPPLPYRRSVKETFSLQVQKGFTIWFLANSEDERNQWSSSITSIISRKPPKYGDYDNWNYFQSEQEHTTHTKTFHAKKSITPQHHSGFYSVEESTRRSLKNSKNTTTEPRSALYAIQDPVPTTLFPGSIKKTGFYSVQETKGTGCVEPPVVLVQPMPVSKSKLEEQRDNSDKCHCCHATCSCLCNIFGSCCHQCCLNCATFI